MSIIKSMLIASATLACQPALADEIAPLHAVSIALGTVAGAAYYTEEAAGYRLVATLADGEGGTPVRCVAVLLPGQRLLFSVPRGPDEPAIEIEFARDGNRLTAGKPATLVAQAAN